MSDLEITHHALVDLSLSAYPFLRASGPKTAMQQRLHRSLMTSTVIVRGLNRGGPIVPPADQAGRIYAEALLEAALGACHRFGVPWSDVVETVHRSGART